MTFATNDYFTNETLSVTLEFEDGGVNEIRGTKIDWKHDSLDPT